MDSHEAILGALLVVLTLGVVMHFGQGGYGGGHGGYAGHAGHAGRGSPRRPHPDGFINPYTELHKKIGALRGARNDGHNQPSVWNQRHGLDRYHRSGATLKPERIAEAEREQWFAPDSGGGRSGGFNPEHAHDLAHDTFAPHETAPAIDYGAYVTDLVVDPRTRDNHRRWVQEMKPWSGTAMMVDDMDEAIEASTDFIGLRRPQAVAQYNPLQLTERDTGTFLTNSKFNFKG